MHGSQYRVDGHTVDRNYVDNALRIHKDTEALASPRSQTARSHDAPTRMETKSRPSIEPSPFTTPTAFITPNTKQPQTQLRSQAEKAGCFRRQSRIASLPETSDDRPFQDVDKHHPRAGRRCLACLALPTVFGCHQRFARDAEHYLKSVAYSQFAPTPPSQPHFKPRNFSCAYFLPTTAFTRTQKVRPASAHKLSYPGMLPRARNLAPLLNTQHTPFRAPLPFTPANIIQPHCPSQMQIQLAFSDILLESRLVQRSAPIAFMHMYI